MASFSPEVAEAYRRHLVAEKRALINRFDDV
jgi:hypothetical protein